MGLRVVFAGLFALLLSVNAFAEPRPLARVDNPRTTAGIFSEQVSVAAGEPVTIAIRFSPDDGWHTYWKNFGDSGKEPNFDWTLPEGWTASAPLYPLPHRIPVGPLMNYGYEEEQTLLVTLSPGAAAADGPLAVSLFAEWLVCEEICIPESGRFDFAIPAGDGADDPAAADLFSAARAALPQPSPFAVSAGISGTAFSIQLAMSAEEAALAREAWFYPLSDGVIGYAAQQALFKSDDGLRLLIARPSYAPAIDQVAGVVVITNDGGQREGFEISAPVTLDPALTPADAARSATPALALWQAILFALVGGMILNLMPCVFPVLSLKAFGLMKAHGEGEAAARRDGLAYTAGVLASFLAVAVIFLLLRETGQAVGWGFQLQMPLVVALLALLLFAVGLNLAGLYDMGIGGLSGVGQRLAGRKGVSGAFFTGMLATVVATPCTAPFMAPALGFAALQPDAVAVAIFLSLGLGLAAPYLLIAFIPALRAALPRPGAWMVSFRKFLAWPMFLTALWLLWVLGLQAGFEAVIVTLAAMMLFAFLFWPFSMFAGSGAGVKSLAALTALALFGGLYWLGGDALKLAGNGAVDGASITASEADFKAALGVAPWTPEKLSQMRAEGRPVFVYFTAAWCITCKVNERMALADGDVAAAAKAAGVAVLEADWTKPDQRIADTLARFGRNGIPLYLYYAPGAADADVLPQILTADMLIARFSREIASNRR